jgi:hypothetical protein
VPGLLVALTVCMSSGVQSADQATQAKLILAPDARYRGPTKGPSQSFVHVTDETCKNLLFSPDLLTNGLLFANKWGPTSVAPDVRLFINARSLQNRPYYVGYTEIMCTNISSFVPLSGHVYEVSQVESSDSCQLQIVDQMTRKPPESLIEYPVANHCGP